MKHGLLLGSGAILPQSKLSQVPSGPKGANHTLGQYSDHTAARAATSSEGVKLLAADQIRLLTRAHLQPHNEAGGDNRSFPFRAVTTCPDCAGLSAPRGGSVAAFAGPASIAFRSKHQYAVRVLRSAAPITRDADK